jgi:ABC-type branched-subunit amino acid transport system substrate-binding protein
MLVSAVGQPLDAFNPKAQRFAKDFAAAYPSGKAFDPFAIYGAQAADVLLTAIARSDGSRADVIRKMLGYRNAGSYLGPIRFDAGGDIVGRGAYGITIYRAGDAMRAETVIRPRQTTVDAANAD